MEKKERLTDRDHPWHVRVSTSQGLLLSAEQDGKSLQASKEGRKILRTLDLRGRYESSPGLMVEVVHPRRQRKGVRWIAGSVLEV